MNSTNKKETRIYYYTKDGKQLSYPVTYSLVFVRGVLTNVFNEHGNSVEKTSECWQYFNSKYN